MYNNNLNITSIQNMGTLVLYVQCMLNFSINIFPMPKMISAAWKLTFGHNYLCGSYQFINVFDSSYIYQFYCYNHYTVSKFCMYYKL